MTTIIRPFIEQSNSDYFKTTTHRFNNLFTPIQSTSWKQSDLTAYVATPLIDTFVLEPIFAIDSSIHLLNAAASFVKALHLWTMNQQDTTKLIDWETSRELGIAWSHFEGCVSALVANTLNAILSIIALLTRPIASLVQAILPEDRSEFSFQ
ncbi:hypothetical protein [Legionella sp. W05-934-2]|jgi:hypothetical protein|uniref:hypothetical protein n=1 Tax=Legionella sp. W05-934-2 TaxID=1198649 RepID=UPI0034631A4B